MSKEIPKDNRQSVRVTSRILFGATPVRKDQYRTILQDFNNGISPYNRQELADIQAFIGAQSALSRLREKDEDMADFLQHLDGKINMLLAKASGRPSILDALQLQTICISGTGLAFWSDQVYDEEEILELRMVLQPEHIFINCFGKVVTCNEDKGDNGQQGASGRQHRISVQFLLIMDDDRENLIQYNFKQQSLALKRRRLQKEEQQEKD